MYIISTSQNWFCRKRGSLAMTFFLFFYKTWKHILTIEWNTTHPKHSQTIKQYYLSNQYTEVCLQIMMKNISIYMNLYSWTPVFIQIATIISLKKSSASFFSWYLHKFTTSRVLLELFLFFILCLILVKAIFQSNP